MPNNSAKAVDAIQQRLANYAFDLAYDDIPSEAIHASKVRVIDTLGALICGFFEEPCSIGRRLAARLPDPQGATIIGTRLKTTPDMAAFVNGTTARCAEVNDVYHKPGSYHGQPSTVVLPILAVAEHAHVNGRELLTGIVLGYEVFLRLADTFHNHGIDNTTFTCLASAVACGKLLGLSREQLAACVAMAAVPNNILTQVRLGAVSMYKTVAAGHAGRAGVFAALLARDGMQGPHLPFEGKAGWCEHVARRRFSLDTLGGAGISFKVLEAQVKLRAAKGNTIAAILAAEKVAPLKDLDGVQRITVEVYKKSKEEAGTDAHLWHPESREVADHSMPYVVAATLLDGTINTRSFGMDRLHDPRLRALMQKIEVMENAEFTKANESIPQQHKARVILHARNDATMVGVAGGDQDDLSSPKSDAQIIDKFRALTEDVLGSRAIGILLERLWNLEMEHDAATLAPALVFV